MAEVGAYALYHIAKVWVSYCKEKAGENNNIPWHANAAMFGACVYEFAADEVFSFFQHRQQAMLMNGLGDTVPSAWEQLQKTVCTPSFFFTATHKTMQGIVIIRRTTSWFEEGHLKVPLELIHSLNVVANYSMTMVVGGHF
jgi:hypothetical protein